MDQSLVLVLNCGSSSIKFAVIEPQVGTNVLHGVVQCIGMPEAFIQWRLTETKEQKQLANVDYRGALSVIIEIINNSPEIAKNIVAVGHRIVHGGEYFTDSVLITADVLTAIRRYSHLAPLHNYANIIGIEEIQQGFPDLPQAAVFDTSFHQTMPPHAYIYPIPYEFYKQYGIRRYGFHGTSHKYVSQQAANMLKKPLTQSAFVTAHLGNGCSAAAILNGKSLDTTMGLTPLEGLVMGTRSGDVDPGLHAYLTDNLGYDIHKVTDILNKNSGLLGISGSNSDMRAIEESVTKGDERAILALEVFCYRLAKHIAALTVPLMRIDALIFTGGIGENSPVVRAKVLHWLQVLNFVIDEESNSTNGKNNNGVITNHNSTIALVVPTNEELLIARDAAFLSQN